MGRNEAAIASGMGPEQGGLVCCEKLKTEGLSRIIEKHEFHGLFLGIRRDEEGSRAKERVFSPRDKNFEWPYKDQPPELWDQFNTSFEPGAHIRAHPILHWTELNIREYIKRVHYSHSWRLALELEKQGAERFFFELFDGGHDIHYDRAFSWFNRLAGSGKDSGVMLSG